MDSIISRSPEQTRALGRSWGRSLPAGWVVGLSGDLGSGKTQLVKGLAQGLGVEGTATSPTFSLIHEMEGGRLPLWHLDLYRLELSRELEQWGLSEYLEGRADVLVAVEWVDRWLGNWIGQGPPPGLAGPIRLAHLQSTSPEERLIRHVDIGA